MSYYDSSHPRSKHDRYLRPTSYIEETYERRGGHGSRQHGFPRRYDGRNDSSVEDLSHRYQSREYDDHSGSRYPQSTTQDGLRRTRSVGTRDHYSYGGAYDRIDDRHRSRHSYHRRDRSSRRSSSSRGSVSPRPRRRKSFGEHALETLGMGVAGLAASNHRSRDRSRDRSRSRSRAGRHRHYRSASSLSPTRSRSRGSRVKTEDRVSQAMKAALAAGATEAFRARNKPGSWTGEKGKRVLTAAISAGSVDGLFGSDKHKDRNVIGSALAGLATNHLLNKSSSKSRSDSRGGKHHRSRSGPLKDIALGGASAAAGKEIYDRWRSSSRGRHRSSDDSESPVRHSRMKKRSNSVSAYVSKGLTALGLDDVVNSHSRRRHNDRGRPSRYSDFSPNSSEDEVYRSRRRGGSYRDVRPLRSSQGSSSSNSSLANHPVENSTVRGSLSADGHDFHPDSDSDFGSSSDDKRQRRKLIRNELVSAGLATVATISAAHGVVKTMEERKKRQQKLKEGELSPEAARKQKIKNNVVGAASIGLAALGVHEAVSGWKEARESRNKQKRFDEAYRERSKRRASLRRAKSHGAYPSRLSLSEPFQDPGQDLVLYGPLEDLRSPS